MAIRRNISVLNPGIIADINIVYGSDLIPIEFYITDYVLPDNAIAILYCETSDKQLLKDVGIITNNVISFSPENGFFTVGKNNLQIRIVADEKSLYTFEMSVNCKPKIATDDAQEVESQPTLVEQLLTEVGKVNGELANQKTDIEEVQDGENIPDFVSYDDEGSHETIMGVSSIKKGDKLRDILSKITKFCNNIRYIIEALALETMHEAGFFTVGDAIVELNGNILKGEATCYYSSTDRMYAQISVDSKWNGITPIVSPRYVDGTPWWNIVSATPVKEGKFGVYASGTFYSGQVLKVDYLLVK